MLDAQLRATLNLIPAHTWYAAPAGALTFVNERCADYLGLSEGSSASVRDRQGRRMGLAHPAATPGRSRRNASSLVRLSEDCLKTGCPGEVSFRVRNADGNYRWFLSRAEAFRGNNGAVICWMGINLDIEEGKEDRKRAEERLQQENVALREEIDKASMFEEIVGTSPALRAVLSQISKVAPTDSTVLITGETGTGKELVARAIHRRSRRASRAFVAVNCAAIPRDLIASELFGHEKGAFTGAVQRGAGRFELADGGTIFLDEVGELSPDIQVTLLRVLQEREFERVGGRDRIRVDVRVIAALNRDLPAAVTAGTFRQDLFYRLTVFPLEMPPLRERPEDIPVLVEYFIGRYARKAGKTFRRVAKRTLDFLRSYPWPGNIRELQNMIARSVIVSDTEELTVDGSWLSATSRVENGFGLSGNRGNRLRCADVLASKEC
jgi:formate hydrogenlyase transcriptional activator